MHTSLSSFPARSFAHPDQILFDDILNRLDPEIFNQISEALETLADLCIDAPLEQHDLVLSLDTRELAAWPLICARLTQLLLLQLTGRTFNLHVWMSPDPSSDPRSFLNVQMLSESLNLMPESQVFLQFHALGDAPSWYASEDRVVMEMEAMGFEFSELSNPAKMELQLMGFTLQDDA